MYNGKSFRTWIFIILIVTLATIPSLDVVFAPSAPSQVTGVIPTAGESQVSLSWTAPSDNGDAITDYIVQHTSGHIFLSVNPQAVFLHVILVIFHKHYIFQIILRV